MGESQVSSIRRFGELVHTLYLNRPTCPHEKSCLKGQLEASSYELFENPDLAKITTEKYCAMFSKTDPDQCPYQLLACRKVENIIPIMIFINLPNEF
jgi:hypothetical protein